MTKLYFETNGSIQENNAVSECVAKYLHQECDVPMSPSDDWREEIANDPDFEMFNDDCLVFSSEIAAKNLMAYLRDSFIDAYIVE